MSEIKFVIGMPLTRLYEKHFLIWCDRSLTPTSPITVKWSDRPSDGYTIFIKSHAVRVINRSNQCPWMWVGKSHQFEITIDQLTLNDCLTFYQPLWTFWLLENKSMVRFQLFIKREWLQCISEINKVCSDLDISLQKTQFLQCNHNHYYTYNYGPGVTQKDH